MEPPMTVAEAAEYARRHPGTITEALRAGALHGVQRVKKGRWYVRRACLDAWILGEACEHQMAVAA